MQAGSDVRVTSAQLAALASSYGGIPTIEAVTVTGTNTLAPLVHYPTSFVMLIVNGQMFFPIGSQPAFSVTANTVTWTSAFYNIQPTDDVIALYVYSH